jgi:MFS family permease
MAAQGKALTYLLTVLGGIAGALLGFIVTGLFAYGLLGLAGMEDREGGRAMIAFISIAPFGALAGLLAGIYLVLRYRGGYRGFAGVVGRGALIVAGIFAVGALVPWIYGLTDDVLVRNGPPPEAKFEIRSPPTASRTIVLSIQGEPDRLFALTLPSNPPASAEFGPWQAVDYVADQPGQGLRKAGAGDVYDIRYRVHRMD